MDTASARRLVYVIHEYPPVTQTFVENEIRAIEAMGVPIIRYVLHPSFGVVGAGAVFTLRSAVTDWPQVILLLRVLFRVVRRAPRLAAVMTLRVNMPDAARQFFALLHSVALTAILLRNNVRRVHLHAHFLSRCLEVTTYAAILIGDDVRTSATGHAADVSHPESPERMSKMVHQLTEVVCASKSVAQSLTAVTGREASAVIHCGVAPHDAPVVSRDHFVKPFRILTVGRLVEKKGLFDCLASARSLAQRGLEYEWSFVGDGPMKVALVNASQDLMEAGSVVWRGHLNHEDVVQLSRNWADVFVLPCKKALSGDVDGIPVALIEAMANYLAPVSTRISGIPELITDDVSGLLVNPGDVTALTNAILRLSWDGSLRQRLSAAARAVVQAEFNQKHEAHRLLEVLALSRIG